MRHRLPSPIRPFDATPPYLIEAAKRMFALCWGIETSGAAVDDDLAAKQP